MKTRLGSTLVSIVGIVFLSLFVLERVVVASVQGKLQSSIASSTVFERRASSSEIIYLDTFDPGDHGAAGPVSSSNILSSGVRYLVTISGTFSVWSDSMWYSVCKGVPENWPQIPSPGITNGKVGVDSAFVFAIPEDDVATCLMDTPYEHSRLEISLDNGVSWFALVPINPIYNTSHIYTYLVEGQGSRAQLRYSDHPTSDNYGVLTIQIENATCAVPFFSQRHENWEGHPLRTNSNPETACSSNYDTIGEGGCTLTSATMLFRYYGADTTTNSTTMTPPNLSDCMNSKACPFEWITGAACSNGKASNPRRDTSFSFARLNQELNQHRRPVILQMCKPKGACNWEGPQTHWVLVVGGQGTDPANYTIWDPWFECGQNMRLNSRSDTWDFVGMAVYDGTPTCGFSTEVPLCAWSVAPVGLPPGPSTTASEQDMVRSKNLIESSNVSGTAVLYRTTNITMTVHLTAQSSVGNVTEMLIWSDKISNTVWQPFAPYVWLPLSDFVYAQFRDEMGNVSAVVLDTPNPSAPPVAPDPKRIYLPLVMRK